MNTKPRGKHLRPVLLWAALALFFCIGTVAGQRLKDLPAPPAPPRLKPTPTPTPVPPPKDEDVDVIRVSSNLVMVPVSVVDPNSQPVLGLQVTDFRVLEQGRAGVARADQDEDPLARVLHHVDEHQAIDVRELLIPSRN